jgi:hypothetical protein
MNDYFDRFPTPGNGSAFGLVHHRFPVHDTLLLKKLNKLELKFIRKNLPDYLHPDLINMLRS